MANLKTQNTLYFACSIQLQGNLTLTAQFEANKKMFQQIQVINEQILDSKK